MIQKEIDKLVILQSRLLLKYPEVIHCISTRVGGVSRGAYRTLNLSFMVGDKAECVLENRRRLASALTIKPESITVGHQVHSCKVKVVQSVDRGKGGLNGLSAINHIDAMVTDKRSIALTALSADCPLIICYDPVKKVCAVIHSSWRGAVEGVVGRAIKNLKQNFASKPRDIIAVISPSIGPCCYEVKEDFIDIVRTLVPIPPRRDSFITRGKKTFFNLWSFNKNLLSQAGLRKPNIESADLCTRHHPEWFYSFRRDGSRTGRFGALISLKI